MLMVGLLMRQRMQLELRPRVQGHLLIWQLRSQVKLQVLLWCTMEAVRLRRWLLQRKVFVMLADRLRLRLRQRRQQRVTRTQGIEVTMRVMLRMRRRGAVVVVLLVAGAHLCTMRRALVPLQQQQEAHQVTLVRRLVGKHYEMVRARWTLRRQQVLLRVLLW